MNTISSVIAHHPSALSASREWERSGLPTLTSPQAFCSRIRYILARLEDEAWLPETLKLRIISCCAHILNEQWQGRLTVERARQQVEELAAASYDYDEFTLDSRTLCQIRALDLELNDFSRQASEHPGLSIVQAG